MTKALQGKLWRSDVYEDKVYFYRCMETFCRDADEDIESMRTTLGMTIRKKHNGGTVYLLGVFDHCDATLVHEAAHLGVFICKNRHISVTVNVGEAFCYLIDAAYRAGKKAGLLRKPSKRKTTR